MARFVFWLGDKLNRTSRFPRRLFGSMFVLLWIGGTLIGHYVPKWYGDGPLPGQTLGWATAVEGGFLIAVAGTSVSVWLWRR